MMPDTIERVKAGDEAALAYIHGESWKAGFRDILSPEVLEQRTQTEKLKEMYRHLLEQNFGNGYLLKVDGEPHGMAWWNVTRASDMPGYAELICIHSLPGRWRAGFGGKLMDKVLEDMASAGYSKVMLWVFEANARARAFYEAKGFATFGKRKLDSEPTEICYERTL